MTAERHPCANARCDAGSKVGGIPADWERCQACGTFQDAPELSGARYRARLFEWLEQNALRQAPFESGAE